MHRVDPIMGTIRSPSWHGPQPLEGYGTAYRAIWVHIRIHPYTWVYGPPGESPGMAPLGHRVPKIWTPKVAWADKHKLALREIT